VSNQWYEESPEEFADSFTETTEIHQDPKAVFLDWKALEAQAKADYAQIADDSDAVAFIVKYIARDLQADYLKIYRCDRYAMNRSPKQAIANLLRLPPLQ